MNRIILFAFAFAVALAACLPSPARVHYEYVVLVAAEAKTTDPPLATVGLTRVTIPRYLDREELATRTGNRLEFAARERWAEPLADSVPRVLADSLEANGMAVASERGDYTLAVDIERFERDGEGSVDLQARWTLRDAARDLVIRSGRTRLAEPTAGAGSEATARAMSSVLGRFAAEVAGTVREARLSRR